VVVEEEGVKKEDDCAAFPSGGDEECLRRWTPFAGGDEDEAEEDARAARRLWVALRQETGGCGCGGVFEGGEWLFGEYVRRRL
jgi:hypothetical protein